MAPRLYFLKVVFFLLIDCRARKSHGFSLLNIFLPRTTSKWGVILADYRTHIMSVQLNVMRYMFKVLP